MKDRGKKERDSFKQQQRSSTGFIPGGGEKEGSRGNTISLLMKETLLQVEPVDYLAAFTFQQRKAGTSWGRERMVTFSRSTFFLQWRLSISLQTQTCVCSKYHKETRKLQGTRLQMKSRTNCIAPFGFCCYIPRWYYKIRLVAWLQAYVTVPLQFSNQFSELVGSSWM